MDGHTLTDALTPRQFSEMTDLDYELVCLLYTAYAAEEEPTAGSWAVWTTMRSL